MNLAITKELILHYTHHSYTYFRKLSHLFVSRVLLNMALICQSRVWKEALRGYYWQWSETKLFAYPKHKPLQELTVLTFTPQHGNAL